MSNAQHETAAVLTPAVECYYLFQSIKIANRHMYSHVATFSSQQPGLYASSGVQVVSTYLVVGGEGPPSNSLRTLWSLQRRVWTPVLWVLLICCNSGIGCRLRTAAEERSPWGRWLYLTGGGWPESEMVIYEAADCETDTAPLTASLRPGVVFERKVSADGLMSKGIDIHTGEIMYLNWFRWPRRV